MSLPPAGWFPNPDPGGVGLRYWDGAQWTQHYHDAEPQRAVEVRQYSAVVSPERASQKAPASTRGAAPTIDEVLSQTQLEQPRHPLEEQVEVAGETYHVKGIKRVFEANAMPITAKGCTLEALQCILMPEPWNPHDPNAIGVLIGPHQVGHVPADLAVHYAAPLGRLAATGVLATGEARVWAKSDGGVVRARVTLLIPEAHRF